MSIIFNEKSKEFHLFNNNISYIIKILRNNHLGQLYFGKRIHQRNNYDYLLENAYRPMSAYVYEGEYGFSLEHIKQEYPSYGTTDFKNPAYEILQKNGSKITNFEYVSHKIYSGKPKLKGLPATYTEELSEADTLEVKLFDSVINAELVLIYTIFNNESAIARSCRFVNKNSEALELTNAMSMCLDLPDCNYEWIQLSGAWAREREVKKRKLEQGIQSISSARGNSGHNHNPFIALKRPNTDEFQGEALGFSLVYSGNFLAQVEVDTYDVTRVLMGINPLGFKWYLDEGEEFQTPEVVMVYSDKGMNGVSQTYHELYRKRLCRGEWRDKVRPILINNWEATYFDFTEDVLVDIAKTAKEDGIELFVLDDGWFGNRCSDTSGLGDWYANTNRLPNGISGLSKKIEDLGMKFGLWFELEMVNKDSDLYRKHPDWVIQTPNRNLSHGRNQYVLDFSNPKVVDYIYKMVDKILSESSISYIKWDMNRSITECYSLFLPPYRQGEVFHRYILGVYELYERLINKHPYILFESCASGGGRFDAGMLYYAPQCWTSDDSDAIERIKIQYGTSYVYPLSSMGAHVSISPNHQLFRNTPLGIRGNVAYFGAFGYELDLTKLSKEEHEIIKSQVEFVKEYREIIQKGKFFRLKSPFENNISAWMVVSENKRKAIVAYFKVLNDVNCPFRRMKLYGLDENLLYSVKETNNSHYGSELMNLGLITTDSSAGQVIDGGETCTDYWSKIYVLNAEE
ncbi:alpha-galactosidase [uncultured Clostridium sp.]|jgi:alpha-galactosidase|uniref:alpha-galactosidase n=1 Tax=uncultured Clostridium sp. TaxID=59620 RepID=UPI00260E2D70|nr:alpha-galactosidase [uncultured Clostridium sp.]